jgi:hypothetical protein
MHCIAAIRIKCLWGIRFRLWESQDLYFSRWPQLTKRRHTKTNRQVHRRSVDGWPNPRLSGARRLTVRSDVGFTRFDAYGSTRGLAGVGLSVESLPVSRGKHSADLNLAVRLDAVPHTVPGTYAEPISWQSWCSSTRRVGVSCRGSISAAVPLRGLSDAGADLQLLRPGSNLLCRGLRSASPTLLASVCRTALPEWSDGATPPCRATRSLPGARQKSDASRFTPIADG